MKKLVFKLNAVWMLLYWCG